MKINFIHRVIRKIAVYLSDAETSIEHPEFVASTSKITKSQLFGDIHIGDFSKLAGVIIYGKVKIGRWTVLSGPNIDIMAEINPVEIGNFCSIARNVSIQEYNHNFKKLTTFFMMKNIFKENVHLDITSKGKIFIGNDVWIGAQCVILSGAHISDGCVIGANSVVASYIPPYSIAIGSPAKVIKFRFDESLIKTLLDIQWWNWSDDKIKLNKIIFTSELTNDLLSQIKE